MTKNDLIANLTVGERFFFAPHKKNIQQVVERKLHGVTFSVWLGPGLGVHPHKTFWSWDRLANSAVVIIT